jgi:transcriptional regulator with XRE-family HTH domain
VKFSRKRRSASSIVGASVTQVCVRRTYLFSYPALCMAANKSNGVRVDRPVEKHKGFDAERYYDALAEVVRAHKVRWRQVARETGITPSTLTRMAKGRRPDAASLAVLSAWAGLNPADYVRNPPTAGEEHRKRNGEGRDPLVAIAGLLKADPNLSPGAVRALENIIHIAYDELKRSPE